MQSKPGINSPTPEIGLKCCLIQQSGAISSKNTLKDSTPLTLVFIHVACASLLLGMRRHLQQHEVARLIQMLEDGSTQRDIMAAFGITQSVGVLGLEPVPGNWWLRQTSGQGHLRCTTALAKTATCAKWLYVAITVLPKHSRWTSCKHQDSESVTKLCATDSMRTAFTADDQHVVPFSPSNTVELLLTLPRIINIGGCVTGFLFSSQTSPDSMSLPVTDI